jgi:hypothetical protein
MPINHSVEKGLVQPTPPEYLEVRVNAAAAQVRIVYY